MQHYLLFQQFQYYSTPVLQYYSTTVLQYYSTNRNVRKDELEEW